MNARLVQTCAQANQFPASDRAEIAVIGRSNCGKSSLINALLGRRLARTSSTPGRTQHVFFFEAPLGQDETLSLVDLPGYGFARMNKQQQRQCQKLMEDYFSQRKQLHGVLLLADVRRAISTEELEIADWIRSRKLALLVGLTKCDKLSKHARFGAQATAKKALGRGIRTHLCSIHDERTVLTLKDALARMMTGSNEAR